MSAIESPAMTRRRLLKIGGATAAGLAVHPLFAGAATDPRRRKPNIVLFYADDLDCDELGCTFKSRKWASWTGAKRLRIKAARGGYSGRGMLTPHIDALAKNGATLERFYITSPVCTPSRYSLMTGRLATRSPRFQRKYPAGTHATLGWDTVIDTSETSLPKALQQAGYKTGLVGKWHNFSTHKGFDKKARLKHAPGMTDLKKKGRIEKLQKAHASAVEQLLSGQGWDFADRINIGNTAFNLPWMIEGALNFIDQHKDAPFFLYVPFPVPHGPYTSSSNNLRKLNPLITSAGLLEKAPDVMPSVESVYQRLKKARIPASHAMATHMDDAVGTVLNKLDALNLRDNTIVLFISDHGSRGKNSCYESAARVPAFMSWPGQIKPGSAVQSLCANTDIAATLVEAAGGTLPADIAVDSRSFLAQLKGHPEPADWRKALLLEIGNTKAAVTRQWKYIANRVPPRVEELMRKDALRAKKTGKQRRVFWTGLTHHNYGNERDFRHYFDADQLYDLDRDLYETTNLAGKPECASTLQEMQEHLKRLSASLPHPFGEFGKH